MDNNDKNKYTCSDCIHFGRCYVRRRDKVSICKDIEVDKSLENAEEFNLEDDE